MPKIITKEKLIPNEDEGMVLEEEDEVDMRGRNEPVKVQSEEIVNEKKE